MEMDQLFPFCVLVAAGIMSVFMGNPKAKQAVAHGFSLLIVHSTSQPLGYSPQ
jgi:hypothetical protein